MQVARLLLCAALAAIRLLAQDREIFAAFEVASVKPHPPDQVRTMMQERQGAILYRKINLIAVIRRAYTVATRQIVGPAWLRDERYDIEAKLPSGATEAQIPKMLQQLLAERFHFEAHHDQRELAVYTITAAKGGLKMRPSEAGGKLGYGPSRDGSGFHLRGKITLPILADVLSDMLGAPVSNRLEGDSLYDLDLSFDDEGKGQGAETMGILLSAIRDQLGIRLESGKAMFDMVVIDRVEKVPEGN